MRMFFVITMTVVVFARLEVQAQDKIDFSRDVKPILSDRCFLCHGPDAGTREADLRLDTEEGAGAVVEAGDVEGSELYLRITSEHDPMPPEDSNLALTEVEKKVLKSWIEEGAKWEQHWSFVKPIKAELPDVKQKSWPANEIDDFILSRMEKAGLSPAPRVSREKLLRRITFDLTGLPPTLAELDEFLADDSERAYENAIDRLLASSRYGERMASDWLDIARYSDTYGYQVDRNRFVWPWRDWVVGAFNDNLPYDQFIVEQLAGDLIPNATEDQILATTFSRLHPQKVEGGSVNEEFRVEYVADRMQTAGMAFLGLTIECARCHDHKYDPITQREYYELFAFFNNIDESGLYSYFDAGSIPSPSMLLPNEKQKQRLIELSTAINKAEENVKVAQDSMDNRFTTWIDKFEWSQDDKWKFRLEENPPEWEKLKGQNKFIADLNSFPGYELTGDDQVNLPMGDFRRHQPFTIATRIKVPDDKKLLERAVVYHRSKAWTDSASRGYQLLIKKGKLCASLVHFWPGNAISIETVDKVPVEKWIHVTVSYDGSSRAEGLAIYIDGQKANVEIIKNNLQKKIVGNGTSHLALGARFRDVGFKNGLISDVRVFRSRLSELEIQEVFEVGAIEKAISRFRNGEVAKLRDMLFELFSSLDQEFMQVEDALVKARFEKNELVDQLREIMVMKEMESPRPTFVLDRGAYDSPSEAVFASTPSVLPPLPSDQKRDRLTFGRWLTSNDHPLTSRVAVNHFWQLLFGEGLVRTPEDFGNQGQQATHPELLDWLAVDFQQHRWDVKRLLKKIMLSSTYRQSTTAAKSLLDRDPENLFLARAPTYRLPAEMIRDNVLYSSGLLVEKLGGAPVRPYELERSFKPSKPDQGEGLYRRSLYTFWQRNGPAPVMLTLDAAKRDVCQVKRERTSSPLAALVQLNNPQTVEASRMLAEKLLDTENRSSEKIALNMFRIATSRLPSEQETKVLLELFESQLAYFNDNRDAMEKFLSVGFTRTEDSIEPEIAAWAVVANMLFSFDECVMKR